MKVDYIVVGFGLAGMAFIHELEKRNKSFVVFDDNPNLSGRIIGGMYNPIILKRFTPAWNAHQMLEVALPFYRDIERKFNNKYIFQSKIYRILQSIEEQNNWMVASDKHVMVNYMIPKIVKENINGIKADFGFGVLEGVGRVDGEQIVEDYGNYLDNHFIKDRFSYEKLVINDNQVEYKDIEAKKIVFAEGSYLYQNPFFNYLPMRPAKGELLVIEVPELNMDFTLKSGVFMVPFGENKYVVGATYNWEDKTFDSTSKAQEELEKKLQKFLKLPYKILDYKVGIRPTIKDRRPLIGKHPKHSNLAILNGLGTRGIILAPGLAKALINHLEEEKPLNKEMDIARFSINS